MVTCPECGAENYSEVRYCAQCGHRLKGDPGAAPTTTPLAPDATSWFDETDPPPAPAPAAYGYAAPASPPAYGYNAGPPPPPAYDYNATSPPPPYAYAAPPPAPPAAPPPVAVRVAPRGRAPSTPRRSHLLRNVLLVVILLLLVGAGAGGYLLYQTVNQPNIPPARLMPADVYGYLSVVPQPKGTQKAALDTLQAAFKSQPGFQAAWDKLFQQAAQAGVPVNSALGGCAGTPGAQPTGTPLSLDDVGSYLGNTVSMAVLPLSKGEITALGQGGDPGKLLTPKLLFLVDLDFNPLNKKGLLPHIKELADKPATLPLAETYRGVEIRKLPDSGCAASSVPTQTLYLALIQGTAALALDPAPLHGVVDQFKDGHSLQESAAFQSLDAELPKDRLGTLYLNLTSIYDTVQALTPADTSGSNTAAKLARPDGAVALALSAHDDGLQIDMAGDTQVAGQAVSTTAAPSLDALNDVPVGSWAVFSGSDLKTTAKQILDILRKQGQGTDLDKSLAQIKDQTGIDVEQDLLPLLGGDYLLSVQGHKGDTDMVFGGVGELRLNAGDGPRMAQIIDKYNKSLGAQGTAPTAVQTSNGSLFQAAPDAPYLYGVVGDKLYIIAQSSATGMAPLADAVLRQQGQGLGTDGTIRARVGHLPAHSNTLLYLDLAKIRTDGIEATLTDTSRADYNQQAAPFLRPLQYLLAGGTATVRNTTTHTHGVLFLGIGK